MRYLVLLFLAGCAAQTSIIPQGPDSYMVSVDDPSGTRAYGTLQSRAATAAQAHCERLGKVMQVTGSSTSGARWASSTAASLMFTCVTK